MKLGVKFLIILICTFILLVISLTSSRVGLNKINENQEKLIDEEIVKLEIVENIRYELAMQGLYARATVIERDDKENKNKLIAHANEVDNLIQDIEVFMDSDEKKRII